MNDVLPQLDGWLKLAGAAVAVALTLWVPFRTWVKEEREYQKQLGEDAANRAHNRDAVARAIPGAAIADSLALRDLADAVSELAAAIRADTESDEQRTRDRLATAVERLIGREDNEGACSAGPPPPRRRT